MSKIKIKELISEPDKMATKEYKEKMIPRLTMVKDKFGSEYNKNIIDIERKISGKTNSKLIIFNYPYY